MLRDRRSAERGHQLNERIRRRVLLLFVAVALVLLVLFEALGQILDQLLLSDVLVAQPILFVGEQKDVHCPVSRQLVQRDHSEAGNDRPLTLCGHATSVDALLLLAWMVDHVQAVQHLGHVNNANHQFLLHLLLIFRFQRFHRLIVDRHQLLVVRHLRVRSELRVQVVLPAHLVAWIDLFRQVQLNFDVVKDVGLFFLFQDFVFRVLHQLLLSTGEQIQTDW